MSWISHVALLTNKMFHFIVWQTNISPKRFRRRFKSKIKCQAYSHCRGSTWLLLGSQWFQTYRWGCSTRWLGDCRSQHSASPRARPPPASWTLPTAETHTCSIGVSESKPDWSKHFLLTACHYVGWLNVLSTGMVLSAAAGLYTGQ